MMQIEYKTYPKEMEEINKYGTVLHERFLSKCCI